MNQHYAQHAKITIKPGTRDKVIELLNKNIEVLERSPGCVYYLISTVEDPNVVWISELWDSKEAKDALAASPETAQTMKELMSFIVSVTDQTVLTVIGGFGIK